MPETNNFNPFGRIINYQPPGLSLSPFYDMVPWAFNVSYVFASLQNKFGPRRPDVDPRKNMFYFQRNYMAWSRHRKRMPWYWLSTFALNASLLYAAALKARWEPDGSGILRALRMRLYGGNDFQGHGYSTLRPGSTFMGGPFTRAQATWTYNSVMHQAHPAIVTERVLKSSEELTAEKDLMKRIFTGNFECFDKKSRWFRTLSAEYLPVSNCAKVNATATESMIRGIEAVVQAKPLAEARAHFAVVERLRYDALNRWKAPTPAADGSFDLRFAFKSLNWKQKYWWREIFSNITRPTDLFRFHERIKYLPQIAVLHWVGWHVFLGFAAAPLEEWKVRNDLDMLAQWGPLDDERSFEDRKADWKNQLAKEAAEGKWVYRDYGWLNGLPKWQKIVSQMYFAD